MHSYTQERLEQNKEYEESLRADEEREERQAIERVIAESLTQCVSEAIDAEEELREEKERLLTLEELRAIRVAYYEPDIQCEAITLAGCRCKRAKQTKNKRFCKIHSKNSLVKTTTS